MAEKQRKVNTPVYGSLAYDLDKLAREQELEEAGRSSREEYVRRPSHKPEIRPRPQARQKVSPVVLGCVAVLTAMVLVLLAGYVQLTETSDSVVRIKRQLTDLEEEHISLLTRYEQAFDLATIKEVAERQGMTKPTGGQVEYLDLSSGDTAVVYGAKDNGWSAFKAAVGKGIDLIVEYFR